MFKNSFNNESSFKSSTTSGLFVCELILHFVFFLYGTKQGVLGQNRLTKLYVVVEYLI